MHWLPTSVHVRDVAIQAHMGDGTVPVVRRTSRGRRDMVRFSASRRHVQRHCGGIVEGG